MVAVVAVTAIRVRPVMAGLNVVKLPNADLFENTFPY